MAYADEATMQALESPFRQDADARLMIKFDLEPVQDDQETINQGRPIFKDVEHITIIIPGDRDNVIHRPLLPMDRQRFAKQYAAWKADATKQAQEGTPLSQWPLVARSQVEELKFFNIHTVEQLADLSDGLLQKFVGGNTLKQKAQTYLNAAKEAAPTEKLRVELAQRDNEIDTLKRIVKEQGDQIAEMRKAKK